MSIYKILRLCANCVSYNIEIHNTIGKVIRNSLTDPLPCITTLQKTHSLVGRVSKVAESPIFGKRKKYIYYQGWSPWHRRRSRCSKPENVNRACYSLEIVVVFDLLGCLLSKPCFNLNFSNPPNWGILIEIEICNDCKNYNWNANWNFVDYRYIEV